MPGFLGGGGGGGGGTGGQISFPKEFIDPVTKFRVSQPENLIDTDFEYGLQPTKWETVELINNTPSFFSKSGDTTIDGIISMTTNAGTREITVITALDHNLAAGIPINVTGTKSLTADGSFIIASIPNPTTFTYLCKSNQNETLSINDLYTSIITGEFFQGSQIGISDSEGILTDGTSTSILTVKTKSTHGFGIKTPLYLLNINSTISQDFQSANTATRSFDASNSATAQTFDGSNTLSTINIDLSNSGVESSIPSTINSVSTTANTITVSHATENFSGLKVGTPLYYDVTSGAGYFAQNPRGVVFLKTTDGLSTSFSTFTVSELPDGDEISIESSVSGTFQLSDLSRTFAGNNVNSETEETITVIREQARPFDGANDLNYTIQEGVIPNKVSTVANYSGSLINVTVPSGAGLEYYQGAMVRYSTTGSAATNLTNNTTYFIDSFFSTGTDTYAFTIKNLPTDLDPITVSGGTGTQTFTRIGVSIDKDIFHIRDSNFAIRDLLEYSFPENGNFISNSVKTFYVVSLVYDAHNYKLQDDVFVPTIATGGLTTEVVDNGTTYKVHTFTTVGSSTFTVSSVGSISQVEYLIVAGGGGGGRYGGGGAGGLLQGTLNIAQQSYSVVVGGGGLGGGSESSPTGAGAKGGNSTFGVLTATGGGAGADGDITGAPLNGGSGGGGGFANFPAGTGISGQGFSGGTGTNNGTSYSGGGGGGAGGSGGNATAVQGGAGGAGINSRISGYNLSYAAGGGGPTFRNQDNRGIGGSNGLGGVGPKYNSGGPVSILGWGGYTNRGSGGSGGYAGGSGVVIIRYPITVSSPRPMVATGGAVTDTTIGGVPYRIHTFTTVGSSTFTVQDVGTLGRVEYLLIGGGASGASSSGAGSGPRGGGGAGGVLTDKELPLPALISGQSYTVTIGNGGAAQAIGEINGVNGQNSSFGSLVAQGGGGGGTFYNSGAGAGLNGASGGGSSYNFNESNGVQLQGFAGRGDGDGAGGGGGAGGIGLTKGGAGDGGDGGIGRASAITGTNTFYGGGGGGGAYPQGTNNMGQGGAGGGGRGGGGGGSLRAVNGTANTGGGGGGGGSGAPGASGGSGLFIIRYPLSVVEG
jgi:hypothetical protein